LLCGKGQHKLRTDKKESKKERKQESKKARKKERKKERVSSPKNEISVINYSPSCRSTPIRPSFIFGTQIKIFLIKSDGSVRPTLTAR